MSSAQQHPTISSHTPRPEGNDAPRAPRLYTSRAIVRIGDVLVTTFAAAVSRDASEVARTVAQRTGVAEPAVRVEAGFDEFDPFSVAMVPCALRDELVRARSMPTSSAYRGYSILVERRFVA